MGLFKGSARVSRYRIPAPRVFQRDGSWNFVDDSCPVMIFGFPTEQAAVAWAQRHRCPSADVGYIPKNRKPNHGKTG